ncbi:E3 ubiquitin-protein ligase RNF181-like [Saccoglossus kowalevskii]|uniref:E3 ubiquitin-protein ligase RNF181 n=1 Tax=Saccoglossus kowalevskii TaxID=10224 RepID=A0ABM0H136_SACKO|nr:PREDICTED: E3 ubiquitin-protein ligase RNF181-like [Saccoglossus kowalevskii]
MASYYDEHDCEPDDSGVHRNLDLLQFARMLVENSDMLDFDLDLDFDGFTLPGERRAPPASIAVVQALPSIEISAKQVQMGKKCPVCLLEFDIHEKAKQLPCQHQFHSGCILPWLKKTNSCPVCRHELLTDDPDYEEYRKQKEKSKEKEARVESLHNSMYT